MRPSRSSILRSALRSRRLQNPASSQTPRLGGEAWDLGLSSVLLQLAFRDLFLGSPTSVPRGAGVGRWWPSSVWEARQAAKAEEKKKKNLQNRQPQLGNRSHGEEGLGLNVVRARGCACGRALCFPAGQLGPGLGVMVFLGSRRRTVTGWLRRG